MIKNYREAKAYLFDLNGTMVDDMQYHIKAWHRILNDLGANISIEKMKEECYGKNSELIERIFPGRFSDEEKERMGLEKQKQYQFDFKPHLKLIDGLGEFLEQAYNAGVKMAIGSAAIMTNIDFVLDGLDIRKYFDGLVSADNVVNSKPDPETWLKCCELLHVEPSECVVFEDAIKGAESAANAGIQTIILTTLHSGTEFRNRENILCFINDFKELL